MAYDVRHPWVQEFVARVQAERSACKVEAYDSNGIVVIRLIRPLDGETVYLYIISHMSGTVFHSRYRDKARRGKILGALDLLLGHKLGYF
jgi:hypothetical protein